jgi:Wiskott-Aldrich syndrome protein
VVTYSRVFKVRIILTKSHLLKKFKLTDGKLSPGKGIHSLKKAPPAPSTPSPALAEESSGGGGGGGDLASALAAALSQRSKKLGDSDEEEDEEDWD